MDSYTASQNLLRLCAGCNTPWLTGDNRSSFFCPKCVAKQPKWDPQPYEPPKIGEKVRVHDCSLYGDSRRHRVIARDGDKLTVCRYLYPGLGEPFEVPLSVTKLYSDFGQ